MFWGTGTLSENYGKCGYWKWNILGWSYFNSKCNFLAGDYLVLMGATQSAGW